MKITRYKQINKGTLLASFSLELSRADGFPDKFTIYNMTWCSKDNRSWVAYPSFSYTTPEGEKKWLMHCRIEDRDANDAFLKKVLDALNRHMSKEVVQAEEDPLPF